jgi:hypothetical protein
MVVESQGTEQAKWMSTVGDTESCHLDANWYSYATGLFQINMDIKISGFHGGG